MIFKDLLAVGQTSYGINFCFDHHFGPRSIELRGHNLIQAFD